MEDSVLKSLLDQFLTTKNDHFGSSALQWTLSVDGRAERVSVNDAEIVGPLCDQLLNLKSLKTLKFVHIDASKIPMEKVCAVESLRELYIYHSECSLHGPYSIPTSLKPLKNLEVLELDGVAMTRNVAELLELNNLKSFKLYNGELTAIPPSVFKAKSLTSLDLSNNKISGAIPAAISALSSLKWLAIDSNQLTGGLEHLAVLKLLETIHVARNKLYGSVPASLGLLEALTDLDLSHNELTDVEPGALGGSKIETIRLNENKLTAFPSLQRINMSAPSRSIKIQLEDNAVPFGPIPLHYASEMVSIVSYVWYKKPYYQGYSLGRNPVETYFLHPNFHFQAHSNYTCVPSAVNFAEWSPAAVQLGDRDIVFVSDLASEFPQVLIMFPKLVMTRVTNYVTLANKIFPALRVFLRKLCEAQNPCVLNALCRLWYAFTYAAKHHRAEEDEMLSYADEIAAIVAQLFKCNALDDLNTFYRLVLPKQYWLSKDTLMDKDDNMNETVWSVMHVFEEHCPIKLCMDCEFKQVLASPAVSTIMEYLFYGSINFAGKVFVDERSPPEAGVGAFEFSNYTNIDATYKGMSCPRYTPAVLFLLEGLGKAVVLLLVASVTIGVYGKDGHTAFANSTAEGFLLLMLFTQLAYEIGQLGTVKWSLKKHLSDIWNALDAVALVLIFAWALLCFFPRQFDVGRTLLSLSAIPLSLQMLQYISLVKAIGLLVLMIKSMIVDVMVFVLVYVVSIFGFGVCFYGLFYGDSPFDSSGATLLYLFQSTLGNFDFGALSGSTYNGIGTVVLVCFLVLTSVLLVNLLIAQMSSTYSRIKDKSREEWSFIMASYVQEYILLRERTPLCLLPPPFNAITIVLSPVHYWALPKYRISIAGTVADYVLGMVLVPFRMAYLIFFHAFELMQPNEPEYYDDEVEMAVVQKALLFVYLLLLSCTYMPLYMSVSAVVRIFFVTVHVVPDGGDTNQYNIWYYVDLQLEEYKKANPLPEGADKATDEDGVELKTVNNVLLLDAAAATAPTSPTTSAEANKDSGAVNRDSVVSVDAADKPVVFFTEDDIHRMFPVDQHHQHRRKADEDDAGPKYVAGGLPAADSAEVLGEVERLRADLVEMKAAHTAAQMQAAAAQAEAKAAQMEMMALIQTLVKK